MAKYYVRFGDKRRKITPEEAQTLRDRGTPPGSWEETKQFLRQGSLWRRSFSSGTSPQCVAA